VAYSDLVLAQLSEYCQQQGWQLEVKQDERTSLKTPRQKAEHSPYFRQVPDSYMEKMTLKRYSYKTIKTY
jgi:hypothetical protein